MVDQPGKEPAKVENIPEHPSLKLWEAVNDRMVGVRKPYLDARVQSGSILWGICLDYFRWLEANPIEDKRLMTHEGTPSIVTVPKPRVPTMNGLFAFIGIGKRVWAEWKLESSRKYREDLVPVMEVIEDLIYDTKFTAASAGLANANLIIRDLALGDRLQVDSNLPPAPADKPDKSRLANLMHPNATPEELDRYYAAGKQPPLYTQEQLDAGAEWLPYSE